MNRRIVLNCGMLVTMVLLVAFPSLCSAQDDTPQGILPAPFIILEWDGEEVGAVAPAATSFYPALAEYYATTLFALVKVDNTTNETMTDLTLTVELVINDAVYMQATATNAEAYPPGTATAITDTVHLNLFPLLATTIKRASLLQNRAELVGDLSIAIDFEWEGQSVQAVFDQSASLQSFNAFHAARPWMLLAYINPAQPEIVDFVRQVLSNHPEATENWEQAAIIYDALALYGVRYQRDPTSRWSSGSGWGLDTIFLPVETMSYRQGDCDDLSVLYATALETIGIPTRLVFAPHHVWVAFAPYDVEMSTKELREMLHMRWDEDLSDYSFGPLQIPISELYGRFNDGFLWIPVETTMLSAPRYSFLGIDGIGWVQNNFTAAVKAGMKQMRASSSELESYSTQEIHVDMGIRPVNMGPPASTISQVPDESELMLLYQTEKWHSGWAHVWLFTRRNWWWAILTLVVCGYIGWRVLNRSVDIVMGYDKPQQQQIDPYEQAQKLREIARLRASPHHKQCPVCHKFMLRTQLTCPRCGSLVCLCGGAIDPATFRCRRCRAMIAIAPPTPDPGGSSPYRENHFELSDLDLCPRCWGLIDKQTMECIGCGVKYGRVCPECQTANDLSAAECIQCGHQLLSQDERG
jgi:transglutaminase-like putative cysteine protease